jgi:hypothetical protein
VCSLGWRSSLSIRISAFHSTQLLAPFIALGAERADELKIAVMKTRMLLVSFSLGFTNSSNVFAKVAVALFDRSH